MPPIPIHYGAVVVAAIASMVIGFLWYGPLFGKMWMIEMGITPDKMEAAKQKAKQQGMTKQYVLMFIGSLVMAYVLAHSLLFANAYLNASGASAGLQAGLWNWLGFIAPVTLSAVLFENKSWKMWCINNGYYLVTLCVMGVILALWV